jgi:hypothetical protein
MAKEKEPISTNPTTPSKDDRPRPKQEKSTTGSLQGLFDAIRIRVLMEDAKPGSASLSKLKELEERLESPDVKTKDEASNQLQELIQIKTTSEAKAEKITTVSGLIDVSNIDIDKKAELKTVAQNIDNLFVRAEADAQSLTDSEIENAHSSLESIANKLGIKENSVGLEEAAARLSWLETSREAREYVADRETYSSPVKEYESEFEVSNTNPTTLKLREVPASEVPVLQARLDKFKQQVSEDLIKVDPKKIEDMTADDLVKRLEETTYWQANMKHLQGRRKWAGSKNINDLRDMLGRVEAQYQALLEDKMVKTISSRAGGEKFDPLYIRESVTQSLRARRRFLRTEYDFDKGVDQGKTRAQVLQEEVETGAQKMQKASEKRLPTSVTTQGRVDRGASSYSSSKEEFTPEESERANRDAKEHAEKVGIIIEKMKLDPTTLRSLRKSPTLRKEMLQDAPSKLNATELKEFESMLYQWESRSQSAMGRELSLKQEELEDLKGSRQYNKFTIKLKAYVERVGLREASSDWDFAIMMREAKEEISRVNSDAGEKLDQWQEALFAPGLATLDEKSFFEVMPKMMSQSRLEHEFGTTYANWEAMQVTGSGDTKKVVSVASFYQLLQKEEVAKRILNADTNGNDSAIQAILVEHIWGDEARLRTLSREAEGLPPLMWIEFEDKKGNVRRGADGEPVKIEKIDVSYFSTKDKKFGDGHDDLGLEMNEFVDQAMWMTHYAKTLWHYSGEWEPFLRDFPGDQLSQANKRLMAIGSAFRDYGLDYGKFDVGYAQLAKAGVLLQDFRTYKAQDVLRANIRHLMVREDENGHRTADAKRGDEIGDALWKMVQKRASISDHYKPVVGMRSVEEIRLMGELPKNDEEGWNWFKNRQEKLGRKGVLSYSQIQALKGKDFNNLSAVEEAWVVQAGEIESWIKDLKVQKEQIDGIKMSKDELKLLLDKQSILTTGEPYKGEISLEAYLKSFEYSSIIDHAQLKKGTDPIDYKNYSLAKQEAAKLMTEVLSGSPSLETITNLYNTMKGYMPPEQLMAWFEEFMKTKVRLRTNQIVPYDIAMTDLEWWKIQRDKGAFDKKDDKGNIVRPKHAPESTLGINPATYKIKDENGDSWNVVGADGFKVTKMKKEWGNHMRKTRDIPGLSAKDIEIQMKLFVGNRWLPNKEVGEEILEGAMGLGQTMDRLLSKKANKTAVAKFIRKWGTKGVMLLRKHPLFDDPAWAFWSILNEFKEFGEEVGKEVQKEVVGGHH